MAIFLTVVVAAYVISIAFVCVLFSRTLLRERSTQAVDTVALAPTHPEPSDTELSAVGKTA
ncbi:hypothetical protein [Flexivirga caeni]|uniref:hypothetical protein n=1 Tax=Flexivirga caeni TaxID=2294115 RepID=UPI0011CEBC2A|nr:hypothetical protein [Flexivirga caeni]